MKSIGMRIVVAGRLADGADRGGTTWSALQYVLGLRRLGHDVLFVTEGDRDSDRVPLERTEAAAYFRGVTGRFGLQGRAAMLRPGTREGVGMSYDEALRFCRTAELLVNLSGAVRDPAVLDAVRLRAWVELDPERTPARRDEGDPVFAAHDQFFTTALAVEDEACSLPSGGVDWTSTLPPVVLEEWPLDGRIRYHALTAVAGWWRDEMGAVGREGASATGAGALGPYLSAPERGHVRFLLAVAMEQEDRRPLELLRRHGWALVDPRRVAGTPDAFRSFVQGSIGGLGPIRPSYAESRCGWLAGRVACYLASGRPVLAHDTGFAHRIPCGLGLVPFRTEEDVVEGVESLHSDYPSHGRAARRIAEAHFDSTRVLTRMLDRMSRDAPEVSRTA